MTGRALLVAGTASHVGKSTVAAGLCRLLADRGVDVAPFKAQNMSNNARAVPRAPATIPRDGGGADTPGDGGGADTTDRAFGEIGVSQYVQARAARVSPTTDHNPVLLKPRGAGESQLVLDGVAVTHVAAGAYYDEHWTTARSTAIAAYDRLAERHDVVVMEGAGSIAEINLHDRDLANVELPRHADAAIVLVVDIERGGAFASLVGTLDLMPEDLRDRVVGALITKFRGDVSLLDDGLDAFEARTGVPVLGVLPYADPGLPEEDSVALPAAADDHTVGDDDGVPEPRTITVAVPRFRRISNATDLQPLAATPGVRVRYQPLDASLEDAHAVVLPGTKNTVDDLRAAHDAGLPDRIRRFEGPIVGLCGGYQMLGARVIDAGLESTAEEQLRDDAPTVIEGVGALPITTAFHPEKTVVAVERDLQPVPALDGATGRVSGYEIHAGHSRPLGPVDSPFPAGDGAARGQILGTYVHGLFENRVAREGFVDATYAAVDRTRPSTTATTGEPVDSAADLVAEHVSEAFLSEFG